MIIVVAACGGGTEGAGGTSDTTQSSAQPAAGPEPSTGTGVMLSPPETVPAGEDTAIPMTVTVGTGEAKWTSARIELTTEGPVSAKHDLVVAGLSPGGSVTGHLTVAIDPRLGGELKHGVVIVTLKLLDGDQVVTARLTQLGLLTDGQTTWMGFVGRGDLERARLRTLLEAGVITQAEFDKAYAETLEQTTGTVEKKDE